MKEIRRYLLKKPLPNGETILETATYLEWREAIKSNKGLPFEDRRHFIIESIVEDNIKDRIIIEVTIDEYHKWNKKRMAEKRKRESNGTPTIISLDAIIASGDSNSLNKELLSLQISAEDIVLDQLWYQKLTCELSVWKPWAVEMLNAYLNEGKNPSTKKLAKKLGVSPQVVCKYKRQFQKFFENFSTGVSK